MVLRELLRNIVKSFDALFEHIDTALRGYWGEEYGIDEACRGRLMLRPSRCYGCGECVRICPTNALEIVKSESTPLGAAPSLDLSRCIFCGLCIVRCVTRALLFTDIIELEACGAVGKLSPEELSRTFEVSRNVHYSYR